jgi:hypothetical protein
VVDAVEPRIGELLAETPAGKPVAHCSRNPWSVSSNALLRIGLVDRRRSLGEDHTRMICHVHQLVLELIPGGAKKALSAAQAKALLAKVRPRDSAGKARRRVAAELVSDLERISWVL